MHVDERSARTDSDIRLHAEKAAWEAQTLLSLFVSLQARTVYTLSPETCRFAEVCYERKLVFLVSTALIECAKSAVGREMAMERLSSNEFQNIQMTWKPLVAHCSQLIRELKMAATCYRLSRLSDLWKMSETGQRQSKRLMEVVQYAFYQFEDQAHRAREEILDWVELYSIPSSSHQVPNRFVNDGLFREGKNIVMVEWNETFAEADAFLDSEIKRGSHVHVIVGNEEDAARFYKTIIDRYSSHGVVLNWHGKEYRDSERCTSPKITIGSVNYFLTLSEVDRKTSAVILHAEQSLKEKLVNGVEEGCLDGFLLELFVLTTVTVQHFHEIEKCLKENSDNLSQLIKSWPSEYQIFDESKLLIQWRQFCNLYGNSAVNKYIDLMRKYTEKWIVKRMIDQYEIPQNLISYVGHYCSSFVKSAIVARLAKLGDDYIVYSERSSETLAIKVRLKKQLNDDFGLQQFLELRHGCEMTPYKIKNGGSASNSLQNYNRVLAIERRNAYRNDDGTSKWLQIPKAIDGVTPSRISQLISSFNTFPTTITDHAAVWKNFNYLMVVVCCNYRLLSHTLKLLKASEDVNVRVCETPLGILQESLTRPSETLVVCTTSACFEGWKFLPRTRKYLKVIIGHHKRDVAALEVAYDLAKAWEIVSCSWEDPHLDPIYDYRVGRERPTTSSTILASSQSLPHAFIKAYHTTGDINDLIQAKKFLHKKLQHLATTAKVDHGILPPPKLDTADSPMDIACGGFLQQSRRKMKEVKKVLRSVEILLNNHGHQYGLGNVDSCAIQLLSISKRYMIPEEELSSFLSTIQTEGPVTWREIRTEVDRFNLPQDADKHWDDVFQHVEPRKKIIALNKDCVSASAIFLQLQLLDLPKDYRKWTRQCSDRHLEDCILYAADPELDLTELLAMDGASLERVFRCHNLSSTTTNFDHRSNFGSVIAVEDSVVLESQAQVCPLYLHPRRCYDRLTRDLFNNGLLVADDYDDIDKLMHQYDTIQLPLINKTTPLSPIESLLRVESALMEYGSLEWMEWFDRRLKYSNYDPEVVQFYHRTIAERDYCVQDERLITRLRNSLEESDPRKVMTSAERIVMDAFVYDTMDSIERDERLVNIKPPFKSHEALLQLAHFIRSRRMPPTFS